MSMDEELNLLEQQCIEEERLKKAAEEAIANAKAVAYWYAYVGSPEAQERWVEEQRREREGLTVEVKPVPEPTAEELATKARDEEIAANARAVALWFASSSSPGAVASWQASKK